jgi:murein DD-endopeptidase MepM/ murein hydrolase activator NlpD
MGAFVHGIVAGLAGGVVFLTGSLSVRILTPEAPAALPSPVPRASPSPASVLVPPPVLGPEYEELRGRRLLLPVEGYNLQRLRDSFAESRQGRIHEAIDLMAPRGTAVWAADDGMIRRLSSGDRGGISVYQVDKSGRYGYYYAHLERYAPFLREGQTVEKGDVIGYVGTTGNAPSGAPHLHFAISRIEDPSRWWQGKPVNPYVLFAAR